MSPLLQTYQPSYFHINESRQRDWNTLGLPAAAAGGNFHINESRQRDWNLPVQWLARARSLSTFTLMNPGNGIETPKGTARAGSYGFHINESRQRDWNKSGQSA